MTTKGSASSRSPARTPQRGRKGPPRHRAAEPEPGLLADHAADLWAIGLVTVGVLLALALYGGAAGWVGRGVDNLLGSAIGWTRYLLPPLAIAAGVLIIAGRHRPEPVRTVVGAALGLCALAGLCELAGGSPTLGATTGDLRSAGGYLGALVGRPLELGLGTAGAVVVLVAAVVVAVVLSTGVSLGTFGRGVAAGATTAGRGVRRWWVGVTTPVEMPPEPDTAQHPPVPPIDAPADAEPEPDAVFDGDDGTDIEEEAEEPAPARRAAELPARPGPAPQAGAWVLPPPELLSHSKAQRLDERQLDQAGVDLVDALAAHGVQTRLLGRTVGPTVTRFELELGPGVKVSRVTSLSRDIAYAMASPDVRILAPIPGRSAIGVEVPNRQRQLVSLGDILASEEAERATHPLEVALGRDIAGRAVMVNLAEMPHVLISGATGAGKSSCINSLVTSVLMRATPDEVRMILVDPKRVELGQYNDLPHLLTQVVVDPKKAANALAWAVKEMERRYNLLAEYGVRDITGYNEAVDRGELEPPPGPARGADAEEPDDVDEATVGPERLPFVLVVVDELNDLMMVAARDVEDSVCRIAQMARAVGIHLVLATQRPSVDVITGVIKANIPSRMAFSVSSLADSRVILDQPGAERLIGKGDMLLLTASSSIPRRLQGPWVSEREVREVVAHWRRQGRRAEPVVGIEGVDDEPGGAAVGEDDDDELLGQAMELVVRSQLGSTSMLQRKLRVGFARAGRLMDLLERRGVVGPSEGSKARAVLMTAEELDASGR
ncbi:MAG: DNA translocase FtsK 4TM domain-containing protein [Acidimicrobiales bacterium]